MQVEVLTIIPPPAGSSSLAQVSIRVHLKTHVGTDCPLLIHDIAVIPDQLTGGMRLAMPRYKRGGQFAPAVLFAPQILRDIGEAVIPEVEKWWLGQSSSAQREKTSSQTVHELGNKLSGGAR